MSHSSNVPAVDDNHVRWSIPRDHVARELASRPLLLMLHGFGSHEMDLFGLAEFIPSDFVVASLRGLIPAGTGFAWFPLEWDAQSNELRRNVDDVNESASSLLAWLDDLDSHVGGLARVILLGFSQGGAMAIQMLRHDPVRFDAAVVLASFATPDSSPGAIERDSALAQANLPVFWGRDPHDPVITEELIAYTRRWLPEHSDLDARLYANVGHGISMEEIEDVRSFLENQLAD